MPCDGIGTPWHILEGIDPMPATIDPMPPEVAKEAFLDRYFELLALRLMEPEHA